MPDRQRAARARSRAPRWGAVPIAGLMTVQLSTGGLLDSEPWGEAPIHLVRAAHRGGGTPGPLLCGLDQHALPVGFSVGGGAYNPALGDSDPATAPCKTCVAVAGRMSLTAGELEVTGSVGGQRAARAVTAYIAAIGATQTVQAATRERQEAETGASGRSARELGEPR